MLGGVYHVRDSDLNTNVLQAAGPITVVKTIAERLKWARTQKGMSQTALAKAAGVSQGTIGNVESGAREAPRELLGIAAALGVAAEWLKDGKGPVRPGETPAASALPPGAMPVRNIRPVFVCGTCRGGLPEVIHEGWPAEVAQEYAEVSSADPRAFLCEVDGDSMVPRYMPREYALVEPSTEPEIEDDVLVRLRSGESMLKRLLGRRGGIRLGSYNDPATITLREDEVSWIYYVAHPVPRRKIKQRADLAAQAPAYTGPERRHQAQQVLLERRRSATYYNTEGKDYPRDPATAERLRKLANG